MQFCTRAFTHWHLRSLFGLLLGLGEGGEGVHSLFHLREIFVIHNIHDLLLLTSEKVLFCDPVFGPIQLDLFGPGLNLGRLLDPQILRLLVSLLSHDFILILELNQQVF